MTPVSQEIKDFYLSFFKAHAKELIAARTNPIALRKAIRGLISFTARNEKMNALTKTFIKYHTFHVLDNADKLAAILHERAFRSED